MYGSKQMISYSVGFKFSAMKVCESNRGAESHLLLTEQMICEWEDSNN